MYNEDNSKQYVGDLGIICMPGCEPFVESVQNYIQGWRKCDKKLVLDASVIRFATGEAKGFIRESVRGKDVFIITDIFNYSVCLLYTSRCV